MDTYIFYVISIILLLISFIKNKKNTKIALQKAWKSFESILPQFLTILLIVGFLLTILNTETISKIIGTDSGWFGVLLSSIVGSVALIPGFVAFSTAATLLQNGAGYMQIAAFISSLMMVGFTSLPLEIKYFGKKIAFMRNLLSFLFSFVVAIIIGLVVSN